MINTTIALVCLTILATGIGLFVSRYWVRHIAIVTLAIFTVIFTMNDMRAHGSEAKRLGRSTEYIAGMVERDQKTFPRRVVIFFSVSGLALLAFVKARNKS